MATFPFSLRNSALWAAATSAGTLLALVTLSSCSSTPTAGTPVAPAPLAALPAAAAPAGPPVWGGPREYEVEELAPIINRALKAGDRDFERGKNTFQSLGCPLCHHFNGGSGGIGPDISGVGGRMGVAGLLTEIIEPSRYISDLFGTKTVTTKDGQTFMGRMVGNDADFVTLAQNFTIDPGTMSATWEGGNTVRIKTGDVDTIEDSGVSPMPPGLINGLKEDQVADLLAYLISGGDPANAMFQKRAAPAAARP